MKRILILLACFLALEGQSSGNRLPAFCDYAKQEQPASDAVWISIRVSHPSAGKDSDYYFDLQRDGALLVLRHPLYQNAESQMRSGTLPESVAQRIFQMISAPEVLSARDIEHGESLFSESDWVNVGSIIGGKFTSAPLWGFTEELKDYPTQFQQVIEELKRIANRLPQSTSVKKVVCAALMEDRNTNLLRNNPEHNYDIIDLAEEDLTDLPALTQAKTYLQRIFPVTTDLELRRLQSLKKASNLKGIGESFYLTNTGQTYQIKLF